MCGIAGVAGLVPGAPISEDQVRAMCACIEHRGPDDDTAHLYDGIGLGMRRLSIIDVAGGNQPIFNEDHSVRTVYNGEIYNFRELRAELEGLGHRFATASDTEIIVHGWEEWGTGFASRLNGMFAIALHDSARKRFVLVRDRIGVKPLYWAHRGDHLVFGSEIKCLLASGLVSADLHVDSVAQFLAWEYVPGTATLLDGVHKLEPGALIDVDLTETSPRVEPQVWWDLPAPGDSPARTATEWEDAVDAQVAKSVRSQLVADVPLGAFLSGGVDSSLMVAGMGDARTFSIGFDDPTYNELEWARRVADHLGVDHQDEIIRPDVVDLFEHLMYFMDDPIGDFSIFPTYLVSKLARGHVTVALSGDGGDELFGGYETYVAERMARRWSMIPAPLRSGVLHPMIRSLKPRAAKKGAINMARRFVEGFDHADDLGHARWRLFAGADMLGRLLTPEAQEQCTTPVGEHIVDLARRAGDRGDLDRGLYVDMKSYLSDNILVKVDRMSMAVSLEARVPYLDHDLVELAFNVPEDLKITGRETKVLLKKVAARHVPESCVYRPKQGFSIPIKHWLGNEFRPLVEELLAPDRLAAEGLFNAAEVNRLRTEHMAGTENHSHILWALLVFQDWRRRWCTT